MPNLLRSLKQFVGLRMQRAQRERTLTQMLASEHALTRSIARAVQDVVRDQFSREEAEFLRAAEALRGDLLSQKDRQLTLTDFGAGNPGSEYTPAQMELGVQITRNVAHICQNGGLTPFWNRMLFKLVRRTERKNGLELGTSLGMSAAYQGRALSLNAPGAMLTTLEGAAPLVEIAQENWRKLGIHNVSARVGKFKDTLPQVLKEGAPFDYAFIDGHHDEHATLAYYRELLPHLADQAILVFDDILWYEGMQRAWKRLVEQPQVACAVNLQVIGVVVIAQQSGGKTPLYELEIR